jgi:Domain of unknown function (DUF4917)
MFDLISFGDALKASKDSNKTVLLGNGFSIAQGGGHFLYSNLLEKSGMPNDSPTRKVFTALDTFDFEAVMKALEDASVIERAYGDEAKATKFGDDATGVREALIAAVHEVHPGIQFEIPDKQREACAKFLTNFTQVFTLNYDLLLYWIILKNAADRFQDGFGLSDDVDGFREFELGAYCNSADLLRLASSRSGWPVAAARGAGRMNRRGPFSVHSPRDRKVTITRCWSQPARQRTSTLPSSASQIDRLGSRSSWAGQRAIQPPPALRPPGALAIVSYRFHIRVTWLCRGTR